MFCDWPRTTDNCRASDTFKTLLVASSVCHLVAGILGVWLMAYRNRGFNLKIVTELFMYVGDGLRPKPMDCIIFFTTVASFVKLPGNLLNILNVLPQNMALRIGVEQFYWVFVSFAFTSFFVGLLYAMPVTTREGIFAVYQPETSVNGKTLRPIHVIIPANTTKNILLAIGALYPMVTGMGFGIISGVLHDRGNLNGSRIAMQLEYSNWMLIFWTLAVMFLYYGLKYTFILRTNIIIAEAELKAPRSTFGIGNLASRSPARFLFVQLQIMGFGGSAVTFVGGGGCLAWVIAQRQVLSMDNIWLALSFAFFWTTSMSAAFFVLWALVTAQTIRNRRRGLHELSNGQSGDHPSQPGGQESAINQGPYTGSSPSSTSRQSKSTPEQDAYPLHISRTSLGDESTLHTGVSSEKYSMDQFRNNHWESSAIAEEDIERSFQQGEQHEPYQSPSLSPPPRPMALPSSLPALGSSSYIQPEPNRSQIRESVFGGRTPREETNGRPSLSSPPQSPTSGGFSLSSRRNQARTSAMSPRASTSSATSTGPSVPRSPTTSTGPTTTAPAGPRLKGNAPKKDVHSALFTVPQPVVAMPVPPVREEESFLVVLPTSSPRPPRQMSQPIPQTKSGSDRKQSVSSDVVVLGGTSVSAPITVPASRGPGGGYRTQSIDITRLPLPPQS
ncbi:hypothetical protein BGX33_008411 [Mortierella sp. NVP41]|nr:hypothetical protein BGX33_008411 [Mortierella sp. NVP41]